jgi:2-keto-4-pentenoate hydratase
MNAETIIQIGQSLYDSELAQEPQTPLSGRYPEMTPADAYAVQEVYATLKREAGATLVGRKIGATSLAIQELFGIDTPDFGQLFDDMLVADGGTIERSELIAPMVEPELDFLMATDLRGPGVTREDVLAATATVLPCMEIIDSRISDWQIAFVDTVADNGSSSRYVVGEIADDRQNPVPRDLDQVMAQMHRNGELVGQAPGTAVLGHPAEAVAWLVNVLSEFGAYVRAGDHVLSGSFMTAVAAEAGDTFTADFGALGSVSVTFGEDKS